MKDKLCAGDLVICIIVALAALAVFAAGAFAAVGGADGTFVVVRANGVQRSYPLDEARTFTVHSNGHELEIEIASGAARIVRADCPDGLCVKCGEIRSEGRTVVCLPARIVLRIGSEEDGYDANVG